MMFHSPKILTVSELTTEIKKTLEDNFEQVAVIGEISNFKKHVSGHWYFNLKDSSALICCTMWKGFNNYVFFTPQDGMKVVVNGKISVYAPRGSYQIDVRSMKPAGIGELQAAFEMLKQKLSAEGLFDPEFKKPIPIFPKKIGIISAIDGAALRDLISVARRRFPIVELLIAPAKVQGSGAADEIVENISRLNSRKDIDLIIVARGGGSIEDLWAFNEEIVVRAIFRSRIPIVTGIGHEVDFTIADFVSDLRAPTPSAAMELATPLKSDFFGFINDFAYNSTQNLIELCADHRNNIKNVLKSYGFRKPFDLVKRKWQQTDALHYRLQQNIDNKILLKKGKLSLLAKTIESHDIRKSLKKGFVLIKQKNKYIPRVINLNVDEKLQLLFYDGEIELNKN
jgi:exodeoxyribonuclease VII large subunit